MKDLKLRWARARTHACRTLLDRIFRGRDMVWMSNSNVPQNVGTVLSIKVEFQSGTGWPQRLVCVWQSANGRVNEIRQIPITKLKFDKKTKMWAFNDG